jgi:hypothetical protein
MMVVEFADKTAARVAIGLVATVILGASIYVSKSRKSELDADLEYADKVATGA